MQKKNSQASDPRKGLRLEEPSQFPLAKNNFIWMGISVAVIIIGFLLMLGKGSTVEFEPDIFSFRRIVLGPTIAFIGFVAMGVAIVVKPRRK